MSNCDYKNLFVEAIKKNADSPKWNSGDFIGIKTISNTKVGNVGQDFIESLCSVLSISYEYPENDKHKRLKQSPWDIKICNVNFELKTATEDTNGNFQFNHIRYHRSYDAVLCLGVTPKELYFGIWSKADITTGKAGNLVSMEKSANASYKLTKRPSSLFPIIDFQQKIEEFVKKI